jgi:hypothetical protein
VYPIGGGKPAAGRGSRACNQALSGIASSFAMKAHGEPAAKAAAPSVAAPERAGPGPANPLWSRLARGGGGLQAKLRVGAPDDPSVR